MANLPRLSSGTLVPLVLSSIPPSADPSLKSPWDALALLVHSCLLSVDFRLVGLGEEHRIDASSEAVRPESLPQEWNESRTSDYAFRYKHPQSSMEYLVKISKLGGKIVISGLGLGDDRVRTFDAPVKDFVSESSFPYTRKSGDSDEDAQKAIEDLFISEGRIADFSALVKLNIIQALVPSLAKQGYEETASTASQSQPSRSQREPERGDREDPSRQPPMDPMPPYAQPRPFHDPLAVPPRRPIPAGDFPPPGFEDEHQILSPPHRGGAYGGPRMPMSGERDLYPPGMGPNDPFAPGGGLRGGGMYPTPDDPMFGGDGGGLRDNRAPPGARYDPTGPFDGPPQGRGGPRFPPHGGGGGFGGPPNPFSGFGGGDFI